MKTITTIPYKNYYNNFLELNKECMWVATYMIFNEKTKYDDTSDIVDVFTYINSCLI